MSSEVDICNLALARLGDEATVTDINPPEGSVQAEHCARFYPIARNSLQENHAWGFCTRRIVLAELTDYSGSISQWEYCYAKPNQALKIISVIDPNAANDYKGLPPVQYPLDQGQNVDILSQYTPVPFALETLADGTNVIWTNQEDAECRFTRIVTDTTKFTPLFTDALSWYLASMLAGPVLKGRTGITVGQSCLKEMGRVLSSAAMSDANNTRTGAKVSPSGIRARA